MSNGRYSDLPDSDSQHIRPTAGTEVKPAFSDISATNLLATVVAIQNSERQAIWARYSALLLANSILFVFSGAINHPGFSFAIHITGILICVSWFLITDEGWKGYYRTLYWARSFSWEGDDAGQGLRNPMEVFRRFYLNPEDEIFGLRGYISSFKNDPIKFWAITVIFIFLITHLSIALAFITQWATLT